MNFQARPRHGLNQLCQQGLHVLILHHGGHGVGIESTYPLWSLCAILVLIFILALSLLLGIIWIQAIAFFSFWSVFWIFLIEALFISLCFRSVQLPLFLFLLLCCCKQPNILFVLQWPLYVLAHLPQHVEGSRAQALQLRHGTVCATNHVSHVHWVPKCLRGLLHDICVMQHLIEVRTRVQELGETRVHLQQASHEVMVVE
mmetsp:Transcript_59774/g.106257  ORF Transcript_59774/g.106257 Transcript_59774/m.106257 type:complete len:201 (+) Transcript_59774:513-1115(+)